MGATEVCIQAGLPPAMRPSLYEDTVRAVKAAAPGLHVHGFSPEEVKYGARSAGVSVREMLSRLRDAGVDTLPGTSAEILDDGLRRVISRGRISTNEWVEVVTSAHQLGIRTTSTMMFGHAETPAQVAAHLALLRDIQKGTGGFTEFVPLSFVAAQAPMYKQWKLAELAQQARMEAADASSIAADCGTLASPSEGALSSKGSADNDSSGGCSSNRQQTQGVAPSSSSSVSSSSSSWPPGLRLRGGPSGIDVIRVHAVSRLMLHRHISNIQASWPKEGLRVAQLLLDCGVNDLGGTLINESISTSAGAGQGQLVRPSTLRQLIREAGRIPAQRDTRYNHIRTFPAVVSDAQAAAEAEGEPLRGFDEGDKDSITHRFGSFEALTSATANRFMAAAKAASAAAAEGGDSGNRARLRQGINGGRSTSSSAGTALHAPAHTRGFYASARAPTQKGSDVRRIVPAPSASRGISSSNVISRDAGGREGDGNSPMTPVTFSPSFTLVPTYECFNSCTYCNFRTNVQPDESQWLSVDKARSVLQSLRRTSARGGGGGGSSSPNAARASAAPPPTQSPSSPAVTEILILSGEISPSNGTRRARWLDLVEALCREAIAAGLLPHTNVGPLSPREMERLARVNASMGLMLEQTAPSLARGVHRFAPSKRDPAARLEQLRQAGRLRIPTTTGILCGIGETRDEHTASLEAIARVAQDYGHIQEVIIQPYAPGATQAARQLRPSMQLDELPSVVESARAILPSNVIVQVPPNLVSHPDVLLACLRAGARDLGGLGPKDEVNPSHAFPLLSDLTTLLATNAYSLQPRLPVYPRHYGWVPEPLRQLVEGLK